MVAERNFLSFFMRSNFRLTAKILIQKSYVTYGIHMPVYNAIETPTRSSFHKEPFGANIDGS